MKQSLMFFVIAASLFASSQSRAELVIGVTSNRSLVRFDSATPGTVTTTAITGLQDQFESVAAIDFRPSNGLLYALGNAPGSIYRIYTLNTTTGVATKIGSDIAANTITGSFVGFDFNPVVDLIRITTDTDQNFRFNPTTAALTATDTNLAYAVGDQGAGSNPNVVGSAYTNSVAGAATTTLFNIDSSRDTLVSQVPPNNGTLNTIGALGVDFQNFAGFDISGATGTAFASTTNVGAPTFSNFYSINLQTGAASLLGQIGSNLVVNDIAVVQAVPEPSSLALLAAGSLALVKFRRRRRK